MSPRQLPVVLGKRIVRALDKAYFEYTDTKRNDPILPGPV
jgi:hypothetical protein